MATHVRTTGIRFDQIQLVGPAVMREIGDLACHDIRTRTEGGRDVDGHPFQAYSEGYAEKKAKYRGIGTGGVDLKGIGPGLRMMDDFGITALGQRRVTIGFRTARKAELAFYHVESGAGRSRVIRDFFGLSQRFLDDAVTRITAHWK